MSFHRNHLKYIIMTWCQNINDQIKQKSSKLCGKTWFAIDMRANRGAQLNGFRAIKAANERTNLYEISSKRLNTVRLPFVMLLCGVLYLQVSPVNRTHVSKSYDRYRGGWHCQWNKPQAFAQTLQSIANCWMIKTYTRSNSTEWYTVHTLNQKCFCKFSIVLEHLDRWTVG